MPQSSPQLLQSVRADCPPQYHSQFDAEMAKLDSQTQGGILTWLQKLKEFLSGMGLSINWGCIFSVWPQIVAALANPALFPVVLVAYLACAHPTP